MWAYFALRAGWLKINVGVLIRPWLSLTEQGKGLEGLCLLHFNGMETSAITLTDKVILELDSQVLLCVKVILLTVACGSDPCPPPPVKPIAGFVIFVFLQKIENTFAEFNLHNTLKKKV